MRPGRLGVIGLAMVWVVGAALPARAQEATNTPAATQPAPGIYYLRIKSQFLSLSATEQGGNDVDKLVTTPSIATGLTRELSLSLAAPLVYESADGEDAGVGDLTLTIKYRPWQKDLGPTDSLRLAVFGGVELPSGDGDFSSHSVDPFVGAVFTAIVGRQGFNQAVQYKFNRGGDRGSSNIGDGPTNAFRSDTAYLFRLSPAEFSMQSDAAWYLTAEASLLWESSGDIELLAGPGLLYEARRFALEVALSLPTYREVDSRPEVDWMLTVGARWLF
jgi:hypothetical protein